MRFKDTNENENMNVRSSFCRWKDWSFKLMVGKLIARTPRFWEDLRLTKLLDLLHVHWQNNSQPLATTERIFRGERLRVISDVL